jgi:pyruvate/2-oxoglutarate dehydrogenase complex dihydrolipoamide acyltransferase (E2) component
MSDAKSVSLEDAAHALAAALYSGNTQAAIKAQAMYEEAVGDDDIPTPDLGPLKRDGVDKLQALADLAPNQDAQISSEAGAATEQDLADAAVNQLSGDVATAAGGSEGEETMAEKAEDISVDANATEAAVRLAEENKVDLSDVKGSGADGRITKGDVEKAS